MYAAADDDSAFAHGRKSLRNQFANGREDNCGVELHRRRFIRPAGPDGAKSKRETFCFFVSWACEGVNLAFLVARYLSDDMRGGAKAVNSEALSFSGFDETSIADQAGAQKRRRFGVTV